MPRVRLVEAGLSADRFFFLQATGIPVYAVDWRWSCATTPARLEPPKGLGLGLGWVWGRRAKPKKVLHEFFVREFIRVTS